MAALAAKPKEFPVYISLHPTIEGWIAGTTKALSPENVPQIDVAGSLQPGIHSQTNNTDTSWTKFGAYSSNPQWSSRPSHYWYNTPQSLQLQMQAMETSLLDQEASNWEIQDPDLMPTVKDWNLCYRYLTKGGTLPYPQSISHDAESFMLNFFSLPPVYRKHLRFAIVMININAVSGQPVIAMQFLKSGIAMIKQMKLHIDPDDSPWLFHLNLSERQKEDRRRAFWTWFSIFNLLQVVCNHDAYLIDDVIECDKMHPPSQVYDPYPIFTPTPTRQAECRVLQFMVKIKKWFAVPPSNIQTLITDQHTSEYSAKVYSIQGSAPLEVVLHTQRLDAINQNEETAFINKIISSGDERVVSMNMAFETAQSVIHRPILFVTSLKSHHPLLLSPILRHPISNAITKCVEAALRVSTLSELSKTLRKLKLELTPVNYSIESFLSVLWLFWFVTCKMDPAWWEFTETRILDAVGLRMRLEDMAQSVRNLENGPAGGGYFTPILACMNSMLREIDHVHEFGRVSTNDGVREIELGMRTVSIGGVDDIQESQATEPYVLLGLLGLEVAGGIRFKGRSEDSWRLFWKLNA
ncbi:hypothetical protein BCR33DRAFT_768870 [Rhizoclosmatium globosum]|uniref:Transcription factor domain-containing protein n=1 Tax=Rhizoclosmatium globosum TaxID=329046 RepID=A0A1Y2BWL4_9FUNG|nr:hypothetical protein BCR33DRAFT_768870 [Rhizoclosmatium globosum]|eukprot:ORY39146.1 hypothetical protein BCR33DRAFT_768870 [Rhizoclosmatium globosum]